jgi:signal peptidase II
MSASKRKELKLYLFLLFLFISIVAIDRVSKYYILKKLSPYQSIPIIKNVFHLSLVYNTGVAFGIFKGNNFIFIIVSFLLLLLLIRYLKDKETQRNFKIALVLIISGAIGNLIDRISLGYVVDFLDLRIWPVFNIADTSISLGLILIVYSLLRRKDEGDYFKTPSSR